MTRLMNRKRKIFKSTAGVLIYCMMLFPMFNTMGSSATKPVEENVELSKKEKKALVEQGVAQFQKGEREQAQKTLEYAKEVFPENYAVPYYLGLIYLEQGRRSDAIAQWQQYVLMDPESEESFKIRKYRTLLIREEALEYAKQAVANEAALLRGPVADNTVAVTTFKNLGSENLGPLGKGMSAMLIHDLAQVPDLQVLERVKLQALLQEMNLGTSGLVDRKTAPKVGKLLKSKYVTTGNLADLEKVNLQIVSVLVDTEQVDRIDTQEVQGPLKKFYDLEKTIACSIIEDLGRDCSKMPGEFRKIHTKSLAALTAFSVGLDYLDQEKYDEAREAFQNALDKDPKFDLAKEYLYNTPLSAMLFMSKSHIISNVSAIGSSSNRIGSGVAGSAIVGGGLGVIGLTTGIIAGVGAVAAAASGGGGGGGGGGPSELNLTGNWKGTWSDLSGTPNGDILLELTQSNTSVDGNVSITGSDCISSGTLNGTVTGNTLDSEIHSGNVTASFKASGTSSSLNGTLQITSGPCSEDTANFSIYKTGSAIIEW